MPREQRAMDAIGFVRCREGEGVVEQTGIDGLNGRMTAYFTRNVWPRSGQ